jgi:hypothetical protein
MRKYLLFFQLLPFLFNSQNLYSETTTLETSLKFEKIDGITVPYQSGILLRSFENKPVKNLLQNFVLNQNYPNPVNPLTKIKYSVLILSNKIQLHVSLKVCSIFGNEVAALVNENQQAIIRLSLILMRQNIKHLR